MTKDKKPREVANKLRISVLADYYLDQPGGKPKAGRLYQAFLRMIERGYWSAGDKIPAELQLANGLPVSLATVQSALRQLSNEGMVIRKRKAGSFIAGRNSIDRERFYYRFHGDNDQQYLPVTDTHLKVEKIHGNGYWSDFLGNHASFVRIERIFDVNGEFLVFNEVYMANPIFDGLLDIPVGELMNVTLRSVFGDRLGVVLAHSERRISFAQLTLGQAKTLKCDFALPAIQYDIRQYTLGYAPLFFMRAIIPQNKLSLQVAAVGS